MLINVTQDHIDIGVPGDAERCPTALAIKDAVKRVFYADVGDEHIRVQYEDADCNVHDNRIPTPQCVYEFFCKFDAGHHVEPYSFELPLSIDL